MPSYRKRVSDVLKFIKGVDMNDNVLAGARCPKCKAEGPFSIQGVALFEDVTDDGTVNYSDVSFPYPLVASCCRCGYVDAWGYFNKASHWECSNCAGGGVVSELHLNKNLEEVCPDCGSTDVGYTEEK